MSKNTERHEVRCSKDDGDDLVIPYERREDNVWYITPPNGGVEMVNPNASQRTVEQLIRKKYDDDY